ncbi:NADH-quinone oxidoreductase subunit K [Geodermatophilus sp. DSM 44513]|uniref:NADH-quinone oxidoreductase subunit K n=1 Tax=Geodermatophilus sp. DSM 44513 TaxID=1528104 RepID=UPI00126C225B|nr:NADH-quinone oxidoreductase subunit K [Geodermatophilus sp. DSM 44513]WNV73747.1 NADH-quinone oxidoreductase subunit K [Geodermatophilus sp. DSM 44513]
MSTGNVTLSLVVGALFAGGAYLLLQRSLLRVVLGFVLIGHGANLVLLVAGGPAGPAPVVGEVAPREAADPLPQALAVTAVVITLAVTALLLALADRSVTLHGDDDVPDAVEDALAGDGGDRQPPVEETR